MTWLRSWWIRIREAIDAGTLLVLPAEPLEPSEHDDQLTDALLEQASKPLEPT